MAEEKVMELLALHNRPFNAQSVSDFLAPVGIKKPACQKALDSLAEAGRLTSKEFGKSKLYWLPQAGLQARARPLALRCRRRRRFAAMLGRRRATASLTRAAAAAPDRWPTRRCCPRRSRTPSARR